MKTCQFCKQGVNEKFATFKANTEVDAWHTDINKHFELIHICVPCLVKHRNAIAMSIMTGRLEETSPQLITGVLIRALNIPKYYPDATVKSMILKRLALK